MKTSLTFRPEASADVAEAFSWHQEQRRALLRHFPYAIYNGIDKGLLEVRAVLHQHRSPTAWQSRG